MTEPHEITLLRARVDALRIVLDMERERYAELEAEIAELRGADATDGGDGTMIVNDANSGVIDALLHAIDEVRLSEGEAAVILVYTTGDGDAGRLSSGPASALAALSMVEFDDDDDARRADVAPAGSLRRH